MALSVLIKSWLNDDNKVENQVVGQVKSPAKAGYIVSKEFNRNGLIQEKVEADDLGITIIGSDPDTGVKTAFSSFVKSGI